MPPLALLWIIANDSEIASLFYALSPTYSLLSTQHPE